MAWPAGITGDGIGHTLRGREVEVVTVLGNVRKDRSLAGDPDLRTGGRCARIELQAQECSRGGRGHDEEEEHPSSRV